MLFCTRINVIIAEDPVGLTPKDSQRIAHEGSFKACWKLCLWPRERKCSKVRWSVLLIRNALFIAKVRQVERTNPETQRILTIVKKSMRRS